MSADRLAATVLVILFGAMAAMAFSYPPQASFLPRLIGSAGFAIAFVRLAISLFSGHSERIRIERQEVIAILWFAGALMTLWLVGVELGAALFILAFLKFGAEVRLAWACVSALLFAALVHVLFDRILEVPLFPGLVFA